MPAVSSAAVMTAVSEAPALVETVCIAAVNSAAAGPSSTLQQQQQQQQTVLITEGEHSKCEQI